VAVEVGLIEQAVVLVATGWPDVIPPQLLKAQVGAAELVVNAELVVFVYFPDEVERLVAGPVTIGAVVKGALMVELADIVITVDWMLEVRL
jgi:hypothetical protein